MFAIVGSVVGMITGYMLGASQMEITIGVWGYNPVLGAMAIGGFFFKLNWQSTIISVLCAVTTCLVYFLIL